MKPVGLVAQRPHQQAHQHRDFLVRTLPIFRRERVQCKVFYPYLSARFNGVPNRFDAFLVTGDPREPAALCPAAVPIHDDGDVDGDIAALFQIILKFFVGTSRNSWNPSARM